jgi:hypothetical protein
MGMLRQPLDKLDLPAQRDACSLTARTRMPEFTLSLPKGFREQTGFSERTIASDQLSI